MSATRGLFEAQYEVSRQCRWAARAYADLQTAYANDRHDDFWYAAQNLLGAYARVSRLLWPTKDTPLAAQLRESVTVSSSSEWGRRMRDHSEHYDERLNKWAIETLDGILVDGQFTGSTGMGAPAQAHLRNFDAETYALTFNRDETFELRPLMAEVERVGAQAQRLVNERFARRDP